MQLRLFFPADLPSDSPIVTKVFRLLRFCCALRGNMTSNQKCIDINKNESEVPVSDRTRETEVEMSENIMNQTDEEKISVTDYADELRISEIHKVSETSVLHLSEVCKTLTPERNIKIIEKPEKEDKKKNVHTEQAEVRNHKGLMRKIFPVFNAQSLLSLPHNFR